MTAQSYYNLGVLRHGQGDIPGALECFATAARMNPEFPQAQYNLGTLLKDIGRLDEGIAALKIAVRVRPGHAGGWNNLGNAYMEQGRWPEARECFRKAIAAAPDLQRAHDNLLMGLYYDPAVSPGRVLEEHRNWARHFADPLSLGAAPHANDRDPDRRLRIGYVSPRFYQSAESFFLVPLLESHDRERFEVCCYADVAREDEVTRRLTNSADLWRPTIRLDDQQLAGKIRDDRIDILVDLMNHGAGNRLLAFARKPAPVQVTYLGYPGTTGMAAMDYRLSDRYLDPLPSTSRDREGAGIGAKTAPLRSRLVKTASNAITLLPKGRGREEQNNNDYSEQTLRLAGCYWCYRPPADAPEVNPLPAVTSGRITLGCLNRFDKVSAECLALWSGAMQALAGSRLLLFADPGSGRQRAIQMMQSRGIQPERIGFVARQPLEKYLATYHQIDIALDTYPCGGATTTCHALWMGVPVVSLIGPSVMGRCGSSILRAVAMDELVATTPERYVEILRRLCGDLSGLAEMRWQMRKRLSGSRLLDSGSFTRDLEEVYRSIWRRWCQAQPRR